MTIAIRGSEVGLDRTLIRAPRRRGLQILHGRQADDPGSRLTSRRLILDAGESIALHHPGEEAVLVLQQGRGELLLDGRRHSVSRRGVFDERATAVLIPPGVTIGVTATEELEAIVVSAPCSATAAASESDRPRADPVLIEPDDVRVCRRGHDGFRREVHDLFVDDPHGRRLMVGETFNPPGAWSSYPPHKHDGTNGEPELEEVYHFRVDPPQGFGIQHLYTAGGESATHAVRDGDVVRIPYGYHPVAAAPGYRLYYLWVLAGERRKLALFEDPDHSWLGAQAPDAV